MRNLLILTILTFMTFSVHAVKIGALPTALSETQGADDIFLIDNNVASATSTRKIYFNDLESRWLQTPNDAGTGLTDFWSASKIIAELANAGGSSTLQETYLASDPSQIVLDPTLRSFKIKDNATPLTTELFSIKSNDEATTFFSVDENKTFVGNGVKFNGTHANGQEAGTLYHDVDIDTLTFYSSTDSPPYPLGQQLRALVINATGSNILKSSVVFLSGSTGGFSSISLARADNSAMGTFIGIVLHDIADGAKGFISSIGRLSQMDTSSYALSDLLYLSDTVNGGWTTIKPTYPNLAIALGQVTVVDNADGVVMAKVSKEFSNFAPTSLFFADANGAPANDDVLTYDSTVSQLNTGSIKVGTLSNDALPAIFATGARNTGLSFPSSVQMRFVSGGAGKLLISTSSITPFVPLYAQNGTKFLPSYSFAGQTNGGLYRLSTDNTLRMSIETLDKQSWSETEVNIGNLDASKTFTVDTNGVAIGYGSYGEFYSNSVAGDTYTITNAGTYYAFTEATNLNTKGDPYVYYTDNVNGDRLTVGANGAGLYDINLSLSLDGSNSQNVFIAIFKNGILQPNLQAERGLGTSPPKGTTFITGKLALANGDYLELRGSSSIAGATINVYKMNFNITRVSK